MPIWLTVLVGLGGSAIGGGITAAILGAGDDVPPAASFTTELASILTSILLVVASRHFIQRRAILGPDALKPPTRGFGIGGPRRPSFSAAMKKAQLLRSLDDLKAHGLLTEDEYAEKRAKLLTEDPSE